MEEKEHPLNIVVSQKNTLLITKINKLLALLLYYTLPVLHHHYYEEIITIQQQQHQGHSSKKQKKHHDDERSLFSNYSPRGAKVKRLPMSLDHHLCKEVKALPCK